MIKNKVLLFGILADAIGQPFIEVEEAKDTDALRRQLVVAYPALNMYPYVIAHNKKVINANQSIVQGDELALLPPFAGG